MTFVHNKKPYKVTLIGNTYLQNGGWALISEMCYVRNPEWMNEIQIQESVRDSLVFWEGSVILDTCFDDIDGLLFWVE